MVKIMRVRYVALFFISCTLVWSVQPTFVLADSTSSYVDETPGMTAGEGSHFQITDSDYLNISLDSTETIRLELESVPKVITMRVEPVSASATSTQLTLTGLAPDTAYFKYEDTYHNLAPLVSDGSGALSYTQDLSQPHLVFIQPKRSTKFIVNDATGGDCAAIGTWDPGTLTCTLTTDLSESMEIDSDGITIDGGGHITNGSQTGNGIYLGDRSGITVRNMRIENFSFGVYLNGGSDNHIEKNDFIDDEYQAVVLYDSNANTVADNTVSLTVPSTNRHQGFALHSSHNNSFQGNAISLNTRASISGRHQGIVLFDSNGNSFTSDTVSDTYQGILLYTSNENTFDSESVSDSFQGILLYESRDNTVKGSTIQRSEKEGLAVFPPTSGNQIYHNNFINNGARTFDYGDTADTFNLPEPEGGNYWDTFDESAEGCDDANADGFCDAAYVFSLDSPAGQDALAWTRQDGWEGTTESRPSNVLFLPGIEGSRLYEGIGCGKDAEERLWEPVDDSYVRMFFGAGDAKVRRLSLTHAGASACADIYTKESDVIDSVRGSDIYKSFIDEMNGLKQDGTIADWRSASYDWRLSLDDLLANGVERDGKIFYEEATSTPYIEQTLRELAASSRSGKVTIVAHSNGGLVTKALLSKLGDDDAASLVDKIILVGAPQSGAPEGLGALLYGYNQGIQYTPALGSLKGITISIVHPEVTRALAQNSPMAYHLLPSEEYLENTAGDAAHPVIRFSGSGYAKEASAYGATIANRAALDDFLLAKDGGRKKPKASDLNSAEVLNPALISYANSTHAGLDFWAPPAGIEVDQIAGWGADTVAGIDFYTEPSRISWLFGPKRSYRPTFIEDGDGTVPVPSALMMASNTNVKRYWLNLFAYNNETIQSRKHKDLFEIPSLEDFIKNIIRNSTSALPDYISSDQPPPATASKKLIFFLHTSPVAEASTTPEFEDPPPKVTLRVKHPPDDKVTGVAEDDTVTEDIPGSTYGEFGGVKYVIVPGLAPGYGGYELQLYGQSAGRGADGQRESGVLALDIQEVSDGVVTASATIADVPVTASTTATLTISDSIDTASPLVVDENGDGADIITVTPVAGETVNYEPPLAVEPAPAPEPETASVPAGRAAGGPGYSPYLPLTAIATPVVVATTTPAIASSTPVATTNNSSATVPPHVATAPHILKHSPAQTSPVLTANMLPNLSQTASVYGASQQSVVRELGRAVYNGLYALWTAFRRLF